MRLSRRELKVLWVAVDRGEHRHFGLDALREVGVKSALPASRLAAKGLLYQESWRGDLQWMLTPQGLSTYRVRGERRFCDSPAKTSPSPDDGPDLKGASDPPSSSSAPESLTLFSEPEAGSSLRTFPDFFPPTVDEISPSYSRRWPSSGFTTSPGECWTADTSECPSEGAASSSLPDVLEADVPPRFFLSPKAAAGILRRAAKRGRELPPALAAALRALASAHPDDDKRTTRTSSTPSTGKVEEPTTTTPRPDASSPAPFDLTSDPAPTTAEASSPTPSEPRDSTPARTALGGGHR